MSFFLDTNFGNFGHSVLYKGCFYGRPGRLTDYNSSFSTKALCAAAVLFTTILEPL